MKKIGAQLCDSCKRRPVCQDFKDNLKMREDGLVIHIVECDMHVDSNSALKLRGLDSRPAVDAI
ncbi:MAG: hypothetical protein AABX51_05945 [Nanoarchaeota archaeon]